MHTSDVPQFVEKFCEVCGAEFENIKEVAVAQHRGSQQTHSIYFAALKTRPFYSCEWCYYKTMRDILFEYIASPALQEIDLREYLRPFLKRPSERIDAWLKEYKHRPSI